MKSFDLLSFVSKTSVLCASLLLCLCMFTEASASRTASGWFYINEIISDSNGPISIVPSVANPECPVYSWWIGQAELIAEGYKGAYATLLAAQATTKEIKVEYESGTTACYVYQVRIR